MPRARLLLQRHRHRRGEQVAERGEGLRGVFAEVIRRKQQAGEITDRIAPETLARIFQAVADGLQVQFMLEPDVDMAATVAALFDALEPRAADDEGPR